MYFRVCTKWQQYRRKLFLLVWRGTDWIVPAANQELKKELQLAKREMLIGHRYVQSHMTGCMIMKFYATDKVRWPRRIGFTNKKERLDREKCGIVVRCVTE
jgi:hypothetical protein